MGNASYYQKTVSDKCLIIDPETALWMPIDIVQIPGDPVFPDGIRISLWLSATTDSDDNAIPVEEIISVSSASTITEPRKILFFGFGEGSNGNWPGESGTKFYGYASTNQTGNATARRSWYRIGSSSRHSIDLTQYLFLEGSTRLDSFGATTGFKFSGDDMSTNTNYATWNFIGLSDSLGIASLVQIGCGNHNNATIEKTSNPTIASLIAFNGADMVAQASSTSGMLTANLPSGWPLNKLVITNPFTTIRLRIHAIAYDTLQIF